MKRVILVVLSLVVVALAVFLVPTIWFKPWSIDHFYARVFARYAFRHPMMLSQLGMLDGTPLDFYSDKLDDFSLAFQKKETRFVEDELKTLRSYDRSKMTPDQKLSAEVLDWFLADQVKNEPFQFHDYPVNQLFGFQSSLPDFMLTIHPLKKPHDAETYVRRVSRFGLAVDQEIEGLELRQQHRIIPPRFVLDKVIAQMQGFIAGPATENPLYQHFVAKTDSMPKLSTEKRDQLRTQLASEIEHTVVPAYQRLIGQCERMATQATDDDGVWKLPDGDAYYERCLESITTTTMGADSLHHIGLREVDRLQALMRGILNTLGYRADDLAAAMDKLNADPRQHYGTGDSARAQVMADYQRIIDDADQRVGALFDVRPKAGVKVERVPAFKEATTPGAYYNAATISGGGRPGIFFVNLRDPAENPKYAMRTLAYHEAIPGHHFQISVAQELKGVAFFRKIIPFISYVEGWGLYAERLALENGFQPTAEDSLGALQAELFRAVRLVVDTGIHHDHWTRQQAIDYMVKNTGMEAPAVVTEIERYIVNPGQACAYKVGQLEILALRQRAMDRLGPRFEIKKFHDVVLTHGQLPMGLLGQVVDEWIAGELRAQDARSRG